MAVIHGPHQKPLFLIHKFHSRQYILRKLHHRKLISGSCMSTAFIKESCDCAYSERLPRIIEMVFFLFKNNLQEKLAGLMIKLVCVCMK